MELIYSFDPSKYALGNPCKRGHLWPGTQQSLRVGSRIGNCVGCRSDRHKGRNWLAGFLSDVIDPDFDTTKYRLGKPCREGHTHGDTGLCLRYNSKTRGHCVECERIRQQGNAYRDYRKEYLKQYRRREDGKAQAKSYYEALKQDSERYQQKLARSKRAKAERRRRLGSVPKEIDNRAGRTLLARGYAVEAIPELIPEFDALWKAIKRRASRTVPQLVHAEQLRYWREHPEARREAVNAMERHRWQFEYALNPSLRIYTRETTRRRKAAQRQNVAVKVSARDIRVRFREFGNCCAYCGATGDLHIEHFIPVSQGGTHVLGNLLPACEPCNYSKRALHPEEWYRAQPFFSELRWRKILRTLGQSQTVGQLSFL